MLHCIQMDGYKKLQMISRSSTGKYGTDPRPSVDMCMKYASILLI